MFNAKLKDGTVISMMDPWHLSELKELRKKRSFFCPVCHSLVQLKLGTTKLWHFAHQANSNCMNSLEKETYYHLNGKRQLFNWLKNEQVDVAMEVYLPLIRQRPDLLFRFNHQIYALEFQCSPIHSTLLDSRTSGYEQLGIIPLWILGGNRLKRHGPHTFSMRPFEWHTIRTLDNNEAVVSYFCPDQSKFGSLHQLTPYSTTRLIASYQETVAVNTSIESFLFPKPIHAKMIEKWLTVKKHWRYHRPTPYKAKAETHHQNLLYRHRIPPSLFPIEAGWPSNHHQLIATSPFHWQTYLLIEFFQHQPLFEVFSIRLAIHCIQPFFERKTFMLRFPNENKNWTDAIHGYFQFLVQIGYLEKKGQHSFRRVRDMIVPSTVEEAISLDQTMYVREVAKIMNRNNEGQNKGISTHKSNI
ncbi:competence protein CoiA family protein [Alkalihalobacillus sp. MEB130]|uniref:competence protein CoiA n=1 Tax=Alkalihalobacillus sp. MEB130 TaxID=2976704 RepID=UPI0028DFBF39|nr:competence protein CoiA family protein [Alkalihalobacillus sp. MEB130]MDT8862738.1 competence protein CoiA family protein [Alkalihalobacillus sp. MEB130]